MRSDYNILSFSITSFLLFSSFFSLLFSFLFFSLIWMIHKIFHVLLLPYHTMAFLMLFIFILGKFCLILYVFKNSLILQKMQFESPLYTHTLLCSAFVALNSGSLLDNLIFKWCTRSKILQKQLIFESCRGQWNVILVLPSIRV